MELASLYTVPLSAINGLSRLTKLTTSKGEGMADLKNFESANHFRIRIESRSFAGPNIIIIIIFFCNFLLLLLSNNVICIM